MLTTAIDANLSDKPTASPRQARTNAQAIGRVLRAGVAISALLIAIGAAIVIAGHDGPQTRSAALGRGVARQAISVRIIWEGFSSGDGQSLVQTGLLVLILAPTARVGLTVVQFARERDRLFAMLAGTVLAVLVLGLIGIGA